MGGHQQFRTTTATWGSSSLNQELLMDVKEPGVFVYVLEYKKRGFTLYENLRCNPVFIRRVHKNEWFNFCKAF